MTILETDRLVLRHAGAGDAEFVLELLNDPGYVRFIGDRGVRTAEEAARYVSERIVDGYERNGFGLYVVELKGIGVPIGICGLVKREALDDVDIGFAFLPRYQSRGYAFESASAVLAHAREALGIGRVVGIVDAENAGSIRVLEKLGLAFDRWVRLSEEGPDLKLFAPPRKETTDGSVTT